MLNQKASVVKRLRASGARLSFGCVFACSIASGMESRQLGATQGSGSERRRLTRLKILAIIYLRTAIHVAALVQRRASREDQWQCIDLMPISIGSMLRCEAAQKEQVRARARSSATASREPASCPCAARYLPTALATAAGHAALARMSAVSANSPIS